MKNKKNGFSLVELLCAICLVGMLSTIIAPIVIKRINSAKTEAYNTLIETIELNAKDYVITNEDKIQDYNLYDNTYISIKTLIDNNYFDSSLINPITKKTIPETDLIYVTRNNKGKIEAKYDINMEVKLKLNDGYNIYLKVGDTFNDPGVTATLLDGTDVTSSIITSGTVNTSSIGTYVITYTFGNSKITRNVIVS